MQKAWWKLTRDIRELSREGVGGLGRSSKCGAFILYIATITKNSAKKLLEILKLLEFLVYVLKTVG